MDKLSYAYGLMIAQSMQQQGITAVGNYDDFTKGLRDVFEGNQPAIAYDEANTVLQKDMEMKQRQAGKITIEEGKAFLDKNAKRDGVKTTASGLQYEVITEGSGKSPSATDTVQVHYEGTLINGNVFDSSYRRGTPASFPVNGVIPGWTEALQMMKEGGKWKIYLPYDIAYGERGAGQDIPPYATLVFTVELIAVK